MPEERNPWRHATRLELKNMVSAASFRWNAAIKDGDIGRAENIGQQLALVADALDDKEN